MSRLALYLLGPPQLELDGRAIHVGRRKVLALLAYLALTRKRHSRETLAAFLAPEFDQAGARADLRRTLSLLTSVIGAGWLTVDRETVGLNPEADLWLDVDRFRQRLATCQAHGHPSTEVCPDCVPLLEEAIALYRGDFMAGFTLPGSLPFDDWQRFESEALRRELASALERLVLGLSAREHYDAALPYAKRWLELNLTHEPAHRALMELYARTGQTSAASSQFEYCVQTLAEELGVPPAAETRQLYQQIRDGEKGVLVEGLKPHNLPSPLVPFIGRETALAEIAESLADPNCRLLTLVGPGGCGKTRLAVEAAARQVGNFTHGVYFVSLAPLVTAEAIVAAVAQALGFSFYSPTHSGILVDSRQQLLDYLFQKRLLLVLDSFEHLLPPPSVHPSGAQTGGANLVTDILRTAPGLKILVTSRTRLNARGEHLYPVSGMDVPDMASVDAENVDGLSEFSAVQLFVQAARRVQPAYKPGDDDITDIARICCLVQGMPLAILLAASWAGILSPDEIATHIAEDTGSAIDFLVTDWQDVTERQRSMRAVIGHSWGLLTDRQRDVFQALSVFRGGFTREAAQHIAGASLVELRELVDRSLLHRTPAGRYEVHELVRQYAAEALDRSPCGRDAVRERHSVFYVTALQHCAEDLKGSKQQEALAGIAADSENAHAAWNWAVEARDAAQLHQAVDGLCLFYEWSGRYRAGEIACRAAVDALRVDASAHGVGVLVKLLVHQSAFSRILGCGERASQLLQESLDLLDRPEFADRDTRAEHAAILKEMGHLARQMGDLEDAMQWCEQSLSLYRSLGDAWEAANVLENLGGVARHLCRFQTAESCFEESLALRRSLGDRSGAADSLIGMSDVVAHSGNVENGERLAREGIKIHREMGNRVGVTNGLFYLGARLEIRGKFAEACPLLEEAAVTYNDLGMRSRFGAAQDLLAWAKTNLGLYDEARALLQMCLDLFQELGQKQNIGMCFFGLGEIALAQEAYAEARQFLEECVALLGAPEHEGLALAHLALAARALGQTAQSRDHICQALRLAVNTGAMPTSLSALSAAALYLADGVECERAVELYALVMRHPYYGNSRFREDVAGKHIAAVAATLPPDVVAAAQERGRARDLNATVKDLLVEFEGANTAN